MSKETNKNIYYEGIWDEQSQPKPEHRTEHPVFWKDPKNRYFLENFKKILRKSSKTEQNQTRIKHEPNTNCYLCNKHLLNYQTKIYKYETADSVYYISGSLEHYFTQHKIRPSKNLIVLINTTEMYTPQIEDDWVKVEKPKSTQLFPQLLAQPLPI